MDGQDPRALLGRRKGGGKPAFPVVEGLDGELFGATESGNGEARRSKTVEALLPGLTQVGTGGSGSSGVEHKETPEVSGDPLKILVMSRT